MKKLLAVLGLCLTSSIAQAGFLMTHSFCQTMTTVAAQAFEGRTRGIDQNDSIRNLVIEVVKVQPVHYSDAIQGFPLMLDEIEAAYDSNVKMTPDGLRKFLGQRRKICQDLVGTIVE